MVISKALLSYKLFHNRVSGVVRPQCYFHLPHSNPGEVIPTPITERSVHDPHVFLLRQELGRHIVKFYKLVTGLPATFRRATAAS
jgi:hypothetical protein